MRKSRKALLAAAAGIAAGCLVAPRVHAATKVQASLVDATDGNPITYQETAGQEGKGKSMIQETTKPGACGTVMKLLLVKIDCASHPDAGTCRVSGNPCCKTSECPSGQLCLGNENAAPGSCNATNHVFEVNWMQGDANTFLLEGQAGLKFNLVKGKAAFLASGKNSVTGGQAFGPIGCSLPAGAPLGFGKTFVRDTGTDPNKCDEVPLFPPNDCTDGPAYLFSGIRVGLDPAPGTCTNDNECTLTQICLAGQCTTQTCAADSECRGFGSGVACNEDTGDCCFLAG